MIKFLFNLYFQIDLIEHLFLSFVSVFCLHLLLQFAMLPDFKMHEVYFPCQNHDLTHYLTLVSFFFLDFLFVLDSFVVFVVCLFFLKDEELHFSALFPNYLWLLGVRFLRIFCRYVLRILF